MIAGGGCWMMVLHKVRLPFLFLTITVLFTACGPDYSSAGKQILDAKKALTLISAGNLVVVDARNPDEYDKEHLAGAVCVSRADITVNYPYPSLVADKTQIEAVLGSRGIGNDATVLVYDGNQNMDAARFWWTLAAYGHDPEKVLVVSGGIKALKAAGAAVNADPVQPKTAAYQAADLNPAMLATKAEVQAQVDNPDPKTVIVDTRTDEEFEAGTIPGSRHVNFTRNNVVEGTYRPVSQIRLIYLDQEIDPAKTVILFCKTSIRGAQSYLALYNAGYRNLKLYDGAWVEWSDAAGIPQAVPVQTPTATELPALTVQDGS